MTFSSFLKDQFDNFIDCYTKYFWKTLGTVLVLTIIYLIATAILVKFSAFDSSTSKQQYSLLSYFFFRYSAKYTYCLVDLSKPFFIFIVSVFSIGLYQLDNNDNKSEIQIRSILKKLRVKDVLILFCILILCSVFDYCVFRIDSFCENAIKYYGFQHWFHSFLFMLRIYLPLLLFSIIIFKLETLKSNILNLKKLFFLFVSLWLFNEFAYEISSFIRLNIFGFILIPFDFEKKYLSESFLGIILIAFYFVGYYSAITTLLRDLESNKLKAEI